MTTFYAQPYNTAVEGFYFQTADQFKTHSNGLVDSFGQPVEEFEIQFMEGGQLSLELFEAWKPGQAEIGQYIAFCDNCEEDAFLMAIIAIRDGGYRAADVIDDPEGLPITLYRTASLKELAEEFLEDGLFGDIPERLRPYLDFEAIGRDLGFDGYTETIVAGEHLVFTFD